MVQLGFSLQANYGIPITQVIELLRDAGFSAVSPVWAADLELEKLDACVRANHMTVQSLHAPHLGIAALWNAEDPLCRIAQNNIMCCIDACARFGIPVAVVHGWQGVIYTVPKEPLDFSAFDRIVAHVAQKQVSIAFENLEGEEYLQALMDRYRDLPHIGYCWDSGHDHCYPHRTDFLEAFGHRLIMTHINDNLGLRDPGGIPTPNDDLHFLPFDGTIDWNRAIGRLKDLPEQKILNFEIKKRSKSSAPEDLIYDSLTPEEFFRLSGQRARRIAMLYDQITSE